MSSGLPILPNLNGFSVHKKPIFASGVNEFIVGRELTVAQQAFPLWEFDLTFEILRTTTNNQVQDVYFADYFTEYESILVVFLQALGQSGRFLYDDPSDDSRTGQFIAMGDGHTTTFRVVRDWGTGDLTLTEPVGEVNIFEGFQFYVDGTPTSVTLDAEGESIVFSVAPANGTTITGDFFFFYKCRFLEDNVSFEEIMYDRWSNKSLKFRSVKTEAVAFGTPNNQPVSGWRVYQLLVPSNLIFDSFSYGCCSLDGMTVVGTIRNAGNFQFGAFWRFDDPHSSTTTEAFGSNLQAQVPVNKHGLAVSIYQTFAANDVGSVWVGYAIDNANGNFLPTFWRTSVGTSDQATTGDPNTVSGSFDNQPGSGAQLWGLDAAGANGVGYVNSTDNGGIQRACWYTLQVDPGVTNGLPKAHLVSQLQNGKPSLGTCLGDDFIFGWDSDGSDLIHAVRWVRADGGGEVLLDVPGGNLYSACFACDGSALYSCGKIITGAGAIEAIQWIGTGSHVILPPLDVFHTIGEGRGVDDGTLGFLVCGISANSAGLMRATAWVNGTPVELPLLTSANPALDVSEAWGCNGDGNMIVGTCTVNGIKQPVIWRLT